MTERDDLRVPSQERAIRTRASLVDAAQREFSERGYASATAKSIAERAGVSTGSFYQYFRDKDQVLYELARERFERVGRLTVGGILPTNTSSDALFDRMRELVRFVIAFHREDPGFHAVLTERRYADPTLDAMTAESEGALVSAIVAFLEGLGRKGDLSAIAFVLFGMVEGAVHSHVLGPKTISDERLVEALVSSMVVVAVGRSG